MRPETLSIFCFVLLSSEKGGFGLGVEVVKAAGVEPEPDAVTGRDAHTRVDTGGDLVAADLAVEKLV